MTHCHHAHDQGRDHDCDRARDSHDCVSAPLSESLTDASLSCCALSGCATLSALSVSGGCVSALSVSGSQKLHDCADDGQHPPGGNTTGQRVLGGGKGKKLTPFGINLMRSQVLYRAAQVRVLTMGKSLLTTN